MGKRFGATLRVGSGRSWGGTLTTAGGLLFFGDDSESFEAVDASTGRALWHFNTGQMMRASPMTYAVDGVQYVAVAAGSDIFSFSLLALNRHELLSPMQRIFTLRFGRTSKSRCPSN